MQAEMLSYSFRVDANPQQPSPVQNTIDNSRQFDELNDFSFDCVKSTSLSQVPADQIFQNGVIKPIYHHHHHHQRDETEPNEFDPNTTTYHLSSSESNVSVSELDSNTYCVWKPKTTTTANNEKESNSWSKRWKLRDMLTRNKISDEDDDNEKKKTTQQQARKKEGSGSGSGRRSSYLPYRQELVGIFGSSRYP